MNLNPRVTLEQWQALVAVVDGGSYAQAAERLHKSQSTVTYAVQKLQSLLGVVAFRIEGRRAVLTPTGRLLYRRARALLEEAGALEDVARTVSAGWEAEIRLAVEIVFPYKVLLACLDRFGLESPHTRIELYESVLAGTTEALTEGRVDLAVAGQIPPGFVGEPLARLRFVAAAHPDHSLHHLGRPVTARDLAATRQLVVRESDTRRATRPTIEAAQRWTLGHMSTSIMAAAMGFGYGWFTEEKIRQEEAAGTLRPLVMREGGERFVELHLVYADRENAGPGTLRLADLLREAVKACAPEHGNGAPAPSGSSSSTAPARPRAGKRAA